MRESFVGVMSLLLLALFMVAFVLNAAPRAPEGYTPIDVVSDLDGSMSQ